MPICIFSLTTLKLQRMHGQIYYAVTACGLEEPPAGLDERIMEKSNPKSLRKAAFR